MSSHQQGVYGYGNEQPISDYNYKLPDLRAIGKQEASFHVSLLLQEITGPGMIMLSEEQRNGRDISDPWYYLEIVITFCW